MIFARKSCFLELLTTVTGSAERAVLDQYNVGVSSFPVTIPATADVICVRDITVDGSGSRTLTLASMMLDGESDPVRDPDGEEVSLGSVYAMLIRVTSVNGLVTGPFKIAFTSVDYDEPVPFAGVLSSVDSVGFQVRPEEDGWVLADTETMTFTESLGDIDSAVIRVIVIGKSA